MLVILLSTITLILGIYIIVIKALSGTIQKSVAIVAFCAIIFSSTLLYFVLPQYIFESMFATMVLFQTTIASVVSVQGLYKRYIAYVVALYLGLVLIMGASVHWIASIVLESSIESSVADLIANSILLVFCILGAIRGGLRKISQNIVQLQKSMKIILFISVWVSALLASVLTFLMHIYYGSPGFAVVGMFSVALIILVGIMCPLLIISNLSSLHYKRLSHVMDKQVRVQAEHYEAVSKKNEDIKRFRHDFNNLRLGLVDSLRRNDVTVALALLEAGEITAKEFESNYKTGNIILDALLNEKKETSLKINTSIVFDGVVPGNLLSPVDICAIFGNAIDNAIEACAKCPHENNKEIKVNSSFTNGFLFIKIENPVAADVKIVNNTIATTKQDKDTHGIGLRSIRTTIEKYNGAIKLSCEDGIFILEIDLDFNMQAKK